LKGPLPISDTEKDAQAEELVRQYSARLNGDKNYELAFHLGVQVATTFPKSPARQKVELPILVRTVPVGYAVSINKIPYGDTSRDQPVVVGKYSSFDPSVVVEIRKMSKLGGSSRYDGP